MSWAIIKNIGPFLDKYLTFCIMAHLEEVVVSELEQSPLMSLYIFLQNPYVGFIFIELVSLEGHFGTVKGYPNIVMDNAIPSCGSS